jgi:hypothetical protein
MDQYLSALAQNDPSAAPLADDVILVENTKKIPVGEGLWKSATGAPTDFKIIVADPDSGEVAFMGVLQENDKPSIAAVRLNVEDHKIKKIDHIVVHNDEGEPLHPNMSRPRPAFLERLPKLQRVPRQKMVEAANSYYEAILEGDGDLAPFADECQRREHGAISAGDVTPAPKEEASGLSVFGRMKCAEQMNTGIWEYITDITDRRILAVDKEKGLVFAFSIFRHDGTPEVIKISNVPGVTERTNDYGAFDLPAAHVFKIRNGKIYEIEAIGFMTDHGVTNGWE